MQFCHAITWALLPEGRSEKMAVLFVFVLSFPYQVTKKDQWHFSSSRKRCQIAKDSEPESQSSWTEDKILNFKLLFLGKVLPDQQMTWLIASILYIINAINKYTSTESSVKLWHNPRQKRSNFFTMVDHYMH